MTRQEAEKLAGAYGMRYVETSARDAINVEHAFTELTRDIFQLVRSSRLKIQCLSQELKLSPVQSLASLAMATAGPMNLFIIKMFCM